MEAVIIYLVMVLLRRVDDEVVDGAVLLANKSKHTTAPHAVLLMLLSPNGYAARVAAHVVQSST